MVVMVVVMLVMLVMLGCYGGDDDYITSTEEGLGTFSSLFNTLIIPKAFKTFPSVAARVHLVGCCGVTCNASIKGGGVGR